MRDRSASLSRRFHIVHLHKTVRSITRQCDMSPSDRQTSATDEDRTAPLADTWTSPFSSNGKPTFVNAYLCIFVSLAVKAVHLEVRSDLTSEASQPCDTSVPITDIHPDNSTNFVASSRNLTSFWPNRRLKASSRSSEWEWRFIPVSICSS